MSRPHITFEQGRTDTVTAVVVPMDGSTRIPVSAGVHVQLWDRARQAASPHRLVRNLSGHLVLLNEPRGQELTFRVAAEDAGYRSPVFVTFTPTDEVRRVVVPLERRPDGDFDDTATLVRGWVVRSGDGDPAHGVPVAGINVSARPQADAAGHQLGATTDDRGVFALVVGLRVIGADEGPVPVATTLRLAEGELSARELSVELEPGRTHVFADAIDLDGVSTPRFTHEAQPKGSERRARGDDDGHE
jgi:hypothetical protein